MCFYSALIYNPFFFKCQTTTVIPFSRRKLSLRAQVFLGVFTLEKYMYDVIYYEVAFLKLHGLGTNLYTILICFLRFPLRDKQVYVFLTLQLFSYLEVQFIKTSVRVHWGCVLTIWKKPIFKQKFCQFFKSSVVYRLS